MVGVLFANCTWPVCLGPNSHACGWEGVCRVEGPLLSRGLLPHPNPNFLTREHFTQEESEAPSARVTHIGSGRG